MKKSLFLTQLRIQLRGIPPEEIEQIIQDYEGYFDKANENGITEEQAAQNLGNPREIAKEIMATHHRTSLHTRHDTTSSVRNAIIIIGLIMFNIVIVLGPLIGVLGFFFGITVMLAAFIISPVISLIDLLFWNGHLFEFFTALVVSGVGLLLFPLLVKLLKGAYRFLNSYIQWNFRVMRGDF